jgi:hypothetical protein
VSEALVGESTPNRDVCKRQIVDPVLARETEGSGRRTIRFADPRDILRLWRTLLGKAPLSPAGNEEV